MTERKLTPEEVRAKLHYDADSGIFTRRSTGKPVGNMNKAGYIRIMVNGVSMLAHRLAFVYMGVELVDGLVVDHVNQVRHCNSWANLRQVSVTENNNNRSKKRNMEAVVLGLSNQEQYELFKILHNKFSA